jgi:hypothetical protein
MQIFTVEVVKGMVYALIVGVWVYSVFFANP